MTVCGRAILVGSVLAGYLAGCAHAIVAEPPAQYLAYDGGPVHVIELPLQLVHDTCVRSGSPFRGPLIIAGCALVRPSSTCTIVVPMIGGFGVDPRRRAAIERHERAHCAGWTHP